MYSSRTSSTPLFLLEPGEKPLKGGLFFTATVFLDRWINTTDNGSLAMLLCTRRCGPRIFGIEISRYSNTSSGTCLTPFCRSYTYSNIQKCSSFLLNKDLYERCSYFHSSHSLQTLHELHANFGNTVLAARRNTFSSSNVFSFLFLSIFPC